MSHRVSLYILAAWSLFTAFASADPSLPKGFVIAPNTASPDGQYAFSAPVDETPLNGDTDSVHNSLINLHTGKQVTPIFGIPGCIHAYEGGILNPWWAKDGSVVAWSTIYRHCQGSLVILKLKAGKVDWQIDLLKTCQSEIISRFKDYYRETLKISWPENGLGNCDIEVNTIPDFFSGQTTEALVLPLKFRVHATGAAGQSDGHLDGEVQPDGTIKFAGFSVFTE